MLPTWQGRDSKPRAPSLNCHSLFSSHTLASLLPTAARLPFRSAVVASHLGKPQKQWVLLKFYLTCVPSFFLIVAAKAPRFQGAASFLCMSIGFVAVRKLPLPAAGRFRLAPLRQTPPAPVCARRKQATSPHPKLQAQPDPDTYLEGSFVLCLSPRTHHRQGRCPSWLTQQALHSNHPTHG